MLCTQGVVRLLAWSRGLPDSVLPQPDSPRAAPAPHRAAGLGPPAPLGPKQPRLPVHVLLLPLQPPADTGTMAYLESPSGINLPPQTHILQLSEGVKLASTYIPGAQQVQQMPFSVFLVVQGLACDDSG